MTHPSPAQVLVRRRDLVLRQDADGFADLFAPGGVIEMPFASPDMPSRLEGREAIRGYARHAAASPLHIDDLDEVAVHHTSDPEVVIVELVTKGTLTTTGRAFAAASVQVFRIRDGKILLFRDYFDPRGPAGVLGD
jgi:uncharacterized protein